MLSFVGPMIRKIGITINILGIICALIPYIVIWVGIGGEEGSIAIIGGADNPAQIVLFADLSVQGKFLTSIFACIFALNIFAFLRKPKN